MSSRGESAMAPCLHSGIKKRPPAYLKMRGRTRGQPGWPRRMASGGAKHLPHHIVQDTAMLEVHRLIRGVDPRFEFTALGGAVLVLHGHLQGLARLDLAGQAFDADGFLTGEFQALAVHALRELQGHHAHADQVGAVDTRSEEHTSELQSRPHLVCRLLLEKKK